MQPPPPIEPEGLLDGLKWRAIVLGALLDNAITLAVLLPLTLYMLATEAIGALDDNPEEVIEGALLAPEYLVWSLVLGLATTVFAAYWAARRAGVAHVRHGGFTAALSLVISLVYFLIPGAMEEPLAPHWYTAISTAGMIPAGMLGGWAATLQPARTGEARPANLLKRVVIGAGVFGVVTMALIAVGVFSLFVIGHRALERYEATLEEGAAYGHSRTDAVCLEQAAREAEGTVDSWELPREATWLEGCLGTASATEAFCLEVPKANDPSVDDWIDAMCERGDFPELTCFSVYTTVSEHCSGWLDAPEAADSIGT
ncbi:MAG: hypothetical protein AAF430_18075 [Myxococcota bacterium]